MWPESDVGLASLPTSQRSVRDWHPLRCLLARVFVEQRVDCLASLVFGILVDISVTQSSGPWMDSKNLLCHEWHSKRRRALLLLYPEIKTILKKDKNQYAPLKSLVLVILAQIFFATLLSGIGAAYGFAWAFGLCLLLSSTLGAWLMFLSQKFVHDCSHQESQRRPALFPR